MNIWDILGIQRTTDKKAIKKAYHAQLKNTHPEENQDAFIRLREAYESALEPEAYWQEETFEEPEAYWQEETFEEPEEDWQEEVFEEPESKEVVIKRQRNKKVTSWWQRMLQVWCDIEKRYDAEEWRKLLYEDIPYEISCFEPCRERLHDFLFRPSGFEYYLPGQVWQVLEGFFAFAPKDAELESYPKRMLNKKIKLCEMIDFDSVKFQDKEVNPNLFFSKYENLLWEWIRNREEETETADEGAAALEDVFDELIQHGEEYGIRYLPFLCLDTAFHFSTYTDAQIEQEIEALLCEFGECISIRLLQAEYFLYRKQEESAREILQQLYREVPVQNFPVLYQMALCCEKVSMFYESYMLIKMLTWLNPQTFMQDMAERLYEKTEAAYTEKKVRGEAISDREHILMCRMYLRSNREKDALRILEEVKEPNRNVWDYHMARCLSIFNEEDISVAGSSYEILEKMDKGAKNGIEKLEWEELQARYLFEQKRYRECIKKCNRLLEEYPISYPVLLLRSYADYCEFGKRKVYLDLDYLFTLFPKRVEIVLVLATMLCGDSEYSDACDILEPVKDKCFAQYEYARIQNLRYRDFAKHVKDWMKFFSLAKDRELSIPPVSKYHLLSLKEMYGEAADTVGRISAATSVRMKWIHLLESLKDSEYNHPEKYVKLGELYYSIGYYKEAEEVLLERLEKGEDEEEKLDDRMQLVFLYSATGNVDALQHQLTFLEEDKLKVLDRYYLYSAIGVAYEQQGKEYEKAEYYYRKSMKEINKLEGYERLARMYCIWGSECNDRSKYEKGIEILSEGLSVWGKIGDVKGRDRNVYVLMANLYVRLGKYEEAEEAMENMRKYTKNEILRQKSHMKMGNLYEQMEIFDKAYECYEKVKEEAEGVNNLDYDAARGAILRIFLLMKKYEEAYKLFIECAYEEEKPSVGLLMCAVHCRYLADGYHDMEFVYEVKKIMETMLENSEEIMGDELGEIYYKMVDVYTILGDTKKAKQYEQMAKDFRWRDEDDEIMNAVRAKLWSLWYQKEYKKAWETIENNPRCLNVGNMEVNAFDYHLRQMKKSGEI